MERLLGDMVERGLEWKRNLWLRLACTKAGAGVEGLRFYEKWCRDSPKRGEKQFVCTSRRGKEFDRPIVSIPWPNSISKAVS